MGTKKKKKFFKWWIQLGLRRYGQSLFVSVYIMAVLRDMSGEQDPIVLGTVQTRQSLPQRGYNLNTWVPRGEGSSPTSSGRLGAEARAPFSQSWTPLNQIASLLNLLSSCHRCLPSQLGGFFAAKPLVFCLRGRQYWFKKQNQKKSKKGLLRAVKVKLWND